jgi:hypothetical protein
MENPIYIPVLLGTSRQNRASENVANFVLGEVGRREGVETELIDVRELNFTTQDAGEGIKDPAFLGRMDRFLGELIWMAKPLRYGPAHIAL